VGILTLLGTVTLAWPHLTVLALAPGMLACGVGQGLTMTPLFRVVLSRVPTDQAGVGSGVLTTTQQTSLALGVATLGSLFASLSAPGAMAVNGAFALVMALQAVLTVVVVVSARKLPDPR
jgi:hypothetical protein